MARLSPGVCAAVVCCALTVPVASAQESLPLVRRIPSAGLATVNAGVLRQQRVDVVAPEALRDPARSQVLTLDLFADVSFRAIRTSLEPTAHGTAWTGTLDAYPESSVVAVLTDGELMAHVYAPFGFFRIQRDEQGNYAVEQTRPDDDIERDDAVVAREAGPVATARSLSSPFADSGSVIDVMVVYTRDALTGFGGETRARAALDLVVAETNTALRNSKVGTSVRLVYSGVVDYAESGDSLVDLGRLQALTDGFLDEVHATRDRYAADLVTLVTERMDQYAGRGYVNSTRTAGAYGFSIVKRTAMSNGRTFAHELGHNIGAHHDWYVTQDAGAFAYSKGYVSLSGRFLDVMAYYNQCADTKTACAQWLGYSNPRLHQAGFLAGVAEGTNLSCQPGDHNQLDCDADNASTLAAMASVVARYRDSRTSSAGPETAAGGLIRDRLR
jgi:hypothetical protein